MVEPDLTLSSLLSILPTNSLYGLNINEQESDSEWTVPQSRFDRNLDRKYTSNEKKRKRVEQTKSHKKHKSNSNNRKSSASDKRREQYKVNSMNSHTGSTNIFSYSFICMVCLNGEDFRMFTHLTCDLCGITIHADCYYGNANLESFPDSSDSLWLCNPCSTGVRSPQCELCPRNDATPIRQTSNGSWAHVVCAQYTNAIYPDSDAYSIDELSGNLWGKRACSLCSDQTEKWLGVCRRCDAGLCNTYCHATCAQQAGLLYQAQDMQPLTQHLEKELADPFYFFCALHQIKELTKTRMKTWIKADKRSRAHKPTFNSDKYEKSSLVERRLKKSVTEHPYPFCKVERFIQFSPSAYYLFQKKRNLQSE